MKKTYDYYFHNVLQLTTSLTEIRMSGLRPLAISTRLSCCSQLIVSASTASSTPLVYDLLSLFLMVDAPYERIEEAQEWWKSLEGKLDEASLRKIGRDNAIKLLKLPLH